MRVLLVMLALLIAAPAMADTTIAPGQRTSISVSGTITTGNTFQSIMAADLNRTGCVIQNTSTHTLYVYFGATASATTSNSLQVSPGASVYCGAGGNSAIALTDNVAITTSTTGDTFVAFYQH